MSSSYRPGITLATLQAMDNNSELMRQVLRDRRTQVYVMTSRTPGDRTGGRTSSNFPADLTEDDLDAIEENNAVMRKELVEEERKRRG